MLVKLYRNRSARTIFLAVFATVTFVASAIWVFDVEPKLMGQFFLASVILLLLIIAAAFALTLLRVLIRRWTE